METQLGQACMFQGQAVWHRPAGLHDEGLALQPWQEVWQSAYENWSPRQNAQTAKDLQLKSNQMKRLPLANPSTALHLASQEHSH